MLASALFTAFALFGSFVAAQTPSFTEVSTVNDGVVVKRTLANVDLCLDVELLGLIDLDLALHLGILPGKNRPTVPCKPQTCKFTGLSLAPRNLVNVDLCVNIALLGLVKVDVAAHLGLLTDKMPRVPCRGSGSNCPQPTGRLSRKSLPKRAITDCPGLLSACPVVGGLGLECVDLTNELENCGKCGNSCADSLACVAGVCVA